MATREQIETMMKLLESVRLLGLSKKLDETAAGIGAVMRYLSEVDGTVTAGQISRFMNVSTARVAVLLKKMEAKGLIVKETGVSDARTTIVRLSAFGRETAERMYGNMCRQIGAVIDGVGMERMLEFVAISKEICAIVKGPPDI